jgi:phage tail sheath protein FI
MVTPTYPGVYVEEVASGNRPITFASTSNAAFVGVAEKGSLTGAEQIFSFTDFQTKFGGFLSTSYLAHAVFQFFNNGGSICYIVRVAGENTATAEITLNDRSSATNDTLTISASSPGLWGNELEVVITNGTVNPGNEINLYVYRNGGTIALESFENLSMVATAANYIEKITSNSSYIRVTVNDLNPTLTGAAAHGTSIGAAVPSALTPPNLNMRINIDGDGYQEVDISGGVGAATGQAADLTTPANIATAIQFVVRTLTPMRSSTDPNAFLQFTATLGTGNVLVLTSGTTGASSSVNVARSATLANDATGLLNIGALEGGVESIGAAATRPQNNSVSVPRYLLGDHSPVTGATGPVRSIVGGLDGDPVDSDTPYEDALTRLDNIDDVSLLCIPGVSSPSLIGFAMNYCSTVRSLSDCFVIADLPQDVKSVTEVQGFVAGISPKDSYAAVYAPWLYINDPTGASTEPVAVPPSGFVAGLYAKTDARRGVWKAPAGTAAAIAGAKGLTVRYTDVEQGLLNPTPYHVNIIREFAASGRVIWGARTITSDTEWNYIPVRRMAIFLRVSIYNGIQWAVFEPNDEPLWAQLRFNLNSFMMTLFRRGAFQGAKASDAYYVKVDSETTTQADIDAGIVNIEIGFAPLKPAEFVVVRISQKAGQSS